MVAWTRRERLERTVEFEVPCIDGGAFLHDVEQAVNAARSEIGAHNHVATNPVAPEAVIRIRPGDNCVYVTYQVQERQ